MPQAASGATHYGQRPSNESELLALATAALNPSTLQSDLVKTRSEGAAAVLSTSSPMPQATLGANFALQDDVGNGRGVESDILALATFALQSDCPPAASQPSTQSPTEAQEILQLADLALGSLPAPAGPLADEGAAMPHGLENAEADIDFDLLALANFALQDGAGRHSGIKPDLFGCPSVAPEPVANSSTDLLSQEEELIRLTELALKSLPAPADPSEGDADAEPGTSDEEGLEYIDEDDSPRVAPAIPGPWTADHFPRAPSDTQSESDDED